MHLFFVLSSGHQRLSPFPKIGLRANAYPVTPTPKWCHCCYIHVLVRLIIIVSICLSLECTFLRHDDRLVPYELITGPPPSVFISRVLHVGTARHTSSIARSCSEWPRLRIVQRQFCDCEIIYNVCLIVGIFFFLGLRLLVRTRDVVAGTAEPLRRFGRLTLSARKRRRDQSAQHVGATSTYPTSAHCGVLAITFAIVLLAVHQSQVVILIVYVHPRSRT